MSFVPQSSTTSIFLLVLVSIARSQFGIQAGRQASRERERQAGKLTTAGAIAIDYHSLTAEEEEVVCVCKQGERASERGSVLSFSPSLDMLHISVAAAASSAGLAGGSGGGGGGDDLIRSFGGRRRRKISSLL
jgi:hypothetical protein